MASGVNLKSYHTQHGDTKESREADPTLQKNRDIVLGNPALLPVILRFLNRSDLANARKLNHSFKLIIDTTPSLKFPLLLAEAKWTANKIEIRVSELVKIPLYQQSHHWKGDIPSRNASSIAWRKICEVEPNEENFQKAEEQIKYLEFTPRAEKLLSEITKAKKVRTRDHGIWNSIKELQDSKSDYLKKTLFSSEQKTIDPAEKTLLKNLSLENDPYLFDQLVVEWLDTYARERTEENLKELESQITKVPVFSLQLDFWLALYTNTKDSKHLSEIKKNLAKIEDVHLQADYLLSIYSVNPTPENLKALKDFADEREKVTPLEKEVFKDVIPQSHLSDLADIYLRFIIYQQEPSAENLKALTIIPTRINGNLTLCRIWLAIYAVDPDTQYLENAERCASKINDKFNRSQAWIEICKVRKTEQSLIAAEMAAREVESGKEYSGVWPQMYEATNESAFLKNALDRAGQFRSDPLIYVRALMDIASACDSILQKIKNL